MILRNARCNNKFYIYLCVNIWPDKTISISLSGFLTAVAVSRKPNAIPVCFSIDQVLNFLLSWLLVLLPSTVFLDVNERSLEKGISEVIEIYSNTVKQAIMRMKTGGDAGSGDIPIELIKQFFFKYTSHIQELEALSAQQKVLGRSAEPHKGR